ncbi:GGDEF domain-containing protein [Rhodanobacter sp. B04]|uniref:two-component regulator propeller domain-containing protein n=1 Tax=Rhodanobacter sp. B04 TaxID=1945860 RepID=UPI000987A774|nr:two-component regulator propeller domain-containing protein [Rhodanobacter sp. B04]OOG61584.1 GGDEF domain-containing protein [Rhodanobacter sp. B04]
MNRWVRGWGALVLVVCGLLAVSPARALDPDRAIGQLTHVWYENQLPQGTVLSIAQGKGGSIWLATYGGLVHYSGAEFDTIDPRVAPVLKSTAITAVYVDRAGTLWVGTLNDGLYRRHGRVLEPVVLPADIKSVFGIAQDRGGALWLTTNAGVARMGAKGIRLLGQESGFPPRGFYHAIVADAAGGVWIAADDFGVVHWLNGQVETFDTRRGLPTNAVHSLAIDHAGTVWVGTQGGPVRYRDGHFERDPRLAALDGKPIYTLHGDRDGSMWFAPLGGMGICRLTRARFDCDNTLSGLVGETVRSMFEDHEGNLWMGTTSSGIHRFSDSKLVTVTGKMDSNAVRAVYQDRAGTLWIGTDGSGLSRYENQALMPATAINAKLSSLLLRAIESDAAGNLWVGSTDGVSRIAPDGTVRNFGVGDGLPGTIVFAFAPSRDGGMWVATLQGVAKISGDKISVLQGTRGDDVRALYEDPAGRLWIGERSGLRCLHDGVVDRCGTDGLPGTSVFAFHVEANGDLWLGTSVGLMRVRGRAVQAFAERAGFYGDAVFAMLDDDDGHFWVSSNRGIARFAWAGIDALDRGAARQIEPRWYGKNDGMLSQQGNGASQTPAWRTNDGRMWFGTANGVVIVDPKHERVNRMRPPVAVERVLVDGKEVDPDHVGRIGPGVERIELHYAAMSYVAPAAVQYRYRIEGFDHGWIDAGNSRVAYYTNLPPGDYVFRVIASNNDGVWNADGASVAFTIVPSWYATWWFRALVAVIVIGLLAMAYRLRVWRLHERERELTHEVAQRTEALRNANAELKRIAALDGLTRIANRGAFDQRLREVLSEHVARGTSLAVLMCDVDAFKDYNDTYGHLAGDVALTAVAGALTKVLRPAADLAARYGGEEFAVLLTQCDAHAAAAVAQRILEAVRTLAIEHRCSDVAPHVTISIGIAAIVPTVTDSPEQLLRCADEALYRAKAAGRDRMAGGPEHAG